VTAAEKKAAADYRARLIRAAQQVSPRLLAAKNST
jgi:hypothetical protein